MISYATVGSNRLDQAIVFYDDLLGSIGIAKMMDHPNGGRLYARDGKLVFGVLRPIDGQAATVGNGTMIGIEAADADAVDAFHARALALGGSNEGDPGQRGGEGSPFYGAYFRDLDGNKLTIFSWRA